MNPTHAVYVLLDAVLAPEDHLQAVPGAVAWLVAWLLKHAGPGTSVALEIISAAQKAVLGVSIGVIDTNNAHPPVDREAVGRELAYDLCRLASIATHSGPEAAKMGLAMLVAHFVHSILNDAEHIAEAPWEVVSGVEDALGLGREASSLMKIAWEVAMQM